MNKDTHSNKVLNQEEIDALLAASGQAPPPVPASPQRSRPAVSSAPQPAAGAGVPEVALERITQLERDLSDTKTAVRQLQQEVQAMVGHIQLISSRLEGVLSNLQSTIGYRARRTFVCDNCQAQGQVAAKVKCTNCSKEHWWGWWPQP